jgi:uncharacterized membrane protein
MKNKIIGLFGGALLGLFVGSGTGIVGGFFGAIGGASVFMFLFAALGYYAYPDFAGWLERRRIK